MTNASTEVHSGTLELEKDAALMFDATCSDVHLKDIIFKGECMIHPQHCAQHRCMHSVGERATTMV